VTDRQTDRQKDGQTELPLGIARSNIVRRALKMLLVTVTRFMNKVTSSSSSS